MALKLDENYNGSTLLSAWWWQVKNNFAAVKGFVDALETDKANTTDVEKALGNKADKTELHKHNNKSILDNITQDTVDDWQKVADAVDDLKKEMAGEYESGLGDQIDRLSDKIGDLNNLPTADKTSIVNAIITLKKLIGNGSGTAAIYAMADYSVSYLEEGDSTNAYVQDKPDDIPLGIYICSPEREIDNIFFVAADDESEIAVYSGKLYPRYTYMLKFGSDVSSKIAEFSNADVDLSQIFEDIDVLYEDMEELRRKQTACELVDAAIEERHISNGAVKERHIADGAVGADQLKDISVGTKKVIDGAITEDKLSEEVKKKLDTAGTPGADGKSAYEYAQEGGYTGTEEEFSAMLAEEEVPVYVREEAKRVADMVRSLQNENTFSIISLADLHRLNTSTDNAKKIQAGCKHACQGAKLIGEQVACDMVVVLGDNVYGYQDTVDGSIEEHNEVNKLLAGLADIRLVGNHDCNTAAALISTQTMYNLIGRFNGNDVVKGDTKIRGYFYKDIENLKLRVIGLNTTDYIDVKGGFNFSDEQLLFFANSLDLSEKDDAENWGILLLSHMPLDYDFFGEDASATYTEPVTMKVVRAYINGSSVTIGNSVVDFNGKNTAEIIANIHGHLHNFKMSTLSGTEVKRLCIPNACFLRNNEYGSESAYPNADYRERFGDEETYDKTAGTAADTAFCVVTVDVKAKKLYATCYGAGIDRETEYAIAKVSYTNLFSISDENYETDMQLRSSGGTKEGTGMFVSGYIPVANGDVIRVSTPNSFEGHSAPIICGYSTDKVFNASVLVYGGSLTFDDDTKTSFTWTSKIDGFIRIGGYSPADGFIITKNEEIV